MSSTRRTVFLFAGANFLQTLLYLVAMVHYPQFLTVSCGYREAYAGMLVGLFAIANFAAVLPIGFLSDRVSPRRMFQASQVLIVLFFGLLAIPAFSRTAWLAFLLFIIGGTGFAAARILLPVLYYKYLPEQRRASNVSLFMSIGFFGFAAGGLIGGYAQAGADLWAHPALPFIIAAIFSIVQLGWSVVLPDARPEKIRLMEYAGDMRNPRVLAVLVVFLMMGLHFGVEQYGLPKLVREGLGIGSKRMGLMYLFIGLELGAVSFLIKELFERRPKHFAIFGGGLIVSGLFHAFTFMAHGFGSLLAIRLGHVAGDALILTMSGVVVAGIFPGRRMGGNVGIVNLANAVGQFGGTFAAGLAIGLSGLPKAGPLAPYMAAFSVTGGIMVVIGGLFILFGRRLGVAEQEVPSA